MGLGLEGVYFNTKRSESAAASGVQMKNVSTLYLVCKVYGETILTNMELHFTCKTDPLQRTYYCYSLCSELHGCLWGERESGTGGGDFTLD